SEYDYRYMAFYDIEEDLDYLTNFNTTIFNCGLTLENSKNYILEEFRLFVEMERVSLPENERKKCYCESCKKLNIPITKNKYQLKKPFRFLVWSCGFCGSEKLKFNGDHQVKKMILSEYKKNNT
ncbi:MAG: hypothetical protein IT256_02490, partial [Chitinophagaceae bacterium]|nr:hypothetical protein [Chitinophagaceae bacterium]